MTALSDILSQGQQVLGHRPWPRVVVVAGVWEAAAAEVANGQLTLTGLWGDGRCVHMALLDEERNEVAVVTMETSDDGRFPSIARLHPPAIRPERAIRDLFGLESAGAPDARPWLDHGRWGIVQPLGAHAPSGAEGLPYRFLPVEGESLHQIPVGPVHAGIIEPGHFRFTASGETVVRLEERFGYVHKGIEALMAGADLDRGARLAGRTSGDSTVAYGIAFACAAEAACDAEAPPRAAWLRALMAETERLANHLGDIGAICNDAAFALMNSHCAILRERVLRAADTCFGHRQMRDCVVPGGVRADPTADGLAALRELLAEIGRRFPPLIELYDNTASLQDRTVGTGRVEPALARQFGAGGYVGRASGRNFDARYTFRYPPYDVLRFDVPVLSEGDVNARVWIRIREVEQSLSLINQILDGMPGGAIYRDPGASGGETREGVALVEGFRGDVFIWLRISGTGTIERCHLRDPSWFQWPLLEAAIEGNIVADFPLCNKSFNCSYSGHDL